MRHAWRLAWVGWGLVAVGAVFALACLGYRYYAGLAGAAGFAAGGALLVRAARQGGLRMAGHVIAALLVMAILLSLPRFFSQLG